MSIQISDGRVHITHLTVDRKTVSDYLERLPEDDREATLVRALEVGVFCLERANSAQDLEFVRRQVDGLMAEVRQAVEEIPGRTEKSLIEKLGTSDGQVLAPIKTMLQGVETAADRKMKEVADLLSTDLNPSSDTSTLGKALRALRELLDPQRKDSVQGVTEAAVESLTKADGTLAQTVRDVVDRSVKPLADEIERLSKEIKAKEDVEEALSGTTAKGLPYEEEVVMRLRVWAAYSGAEVEHVGPDNRAGDVIVRLGGPLAGIEDFSIAIEVRDRTSRVGRKQLGDQLAAVITERQTQSALYLSRTSDGLALEIGSWAEGEVAGGSYVACTDEYLTVAIRYLIAREKLMRLRAQSSAVDTVAVEAQLTRVRTSIARVKTINRRVSDIKTTADAISDEAEQLRTEIRDALFEVDTALKVAGEGGASSDSPPTQPSLTPSLN